MHVYYKMANSSATVVKIARVLAIAHIVVGVLLILFGIGDRLTAGPFFWATGFIYFGVWSGLWMCITGSLGIHVSGRERTRSCSVCVGIFLGFAITSVLMGGTIIIVYSVSFFFDTKSRSRDDGVKISRRYRDMYDAKLAIAAVILFLGIVEFVIGILAAVCCCMMRPCTCCALQQEEQVVYTASTPGCVVIQGPDGIPVAVPTQSVDGMVAVQASGVQGSQPPMVLLPTSGAVEDPPLIFQVSSSHTVPATGYPPQQTEMPPPYEHVQYTPLNEEEQQMARSFSTADYAMTPTPVGGRVSVPVQAGSDMFAVRESRDQGEQPPEVIVCVSEATKEQLNFSNAAPVVEMQSTGYPNPQVSKPPTVTYV